MIVTKNVSDNELLSAGTEILSINGHAMSSILDSLLAVTPADGSNNGKRLNKLQLSGTIKHEYFDIYFPLFFPVDAGAFTLEIMKKGEKETVSADAITTAERKEKLNTQFGLVADSYDALWEFNFPSENTAYLKMGTFVTWQMEMDWKAFLQDAFTEIRARNAEHLIIDIRGNEGGSGDVMDFLQKHLSTKPITLKASRDVVRYQKVSDKNRPYLGTWDDKIFDITWRVVEEKTASTNRVLIKVKTK